MTAHTTRTAHTPRTAHTTLVEDVARAAESAEGVAFLTPGLAARLRSAVSRPEPGTGGADPAGVRMTRPDGTGVWHVEIHVVALRRARAVDVARAARESVERRLTALFPEQPAPRVTVTVTGVV
ncbi:hypothetical protein K4B79_21430 [Streptomyces lincolnensis]|uniref:hypothetical protein n=1 Tax=Streptomyces lincolnensis TaxID=1915 RepID=UPI001E51776C|nr:hypothetical protein [Streptomyces lincolnensis]MCD7440776.1 hypothetical protein [Streptomyces lincolnensis]